MAEKEEGFGKGREIKREVEHIRQEVDLHREVDEKAFQQIRDDIHKIANK